MSKKDHIVKAIEDNPQESRKEWMLSEFAKAAAKSSNVKHLGLYKYLAYSIPAIYTLS